MKPMVSDLNTFGPRFFRVCQGHLLAVQISYMNAQYRLLVIVTTADNTRRGKFRDPEKCLGERGGEWGQRLRSPGAEQARLPMSCKSGACTALLETLP